MTWSSQVVAGMNYFLTFERSNGDKVVYTYFVPLTR